MNLKKTMFIFLIFLSLALFIGSASAENSTVVDEQNPIQENVVPVEETQNTNQSEIQQVTKDSQQAPAKKTN